MPAFSSQDQAFVSEIFSSLQGEGPRMGERHLFIRVAGCGVRCAYCDEYGKPGRVMLLEEILAVLEDLQSSEGPHSCVSITGGEPLEQAPALRRLLPELRHRKQRILLETNGIHWREFQDLVEGCDIISMDLKLPSVGRHKDFLEEHRKFLTIASSAELYVKLVVSAALDPEEFDRHIAMIAGTAPNVPVFIQPAWREGALPDMPADWIKRARGCLSDVRFGIQLHKILHLK